MLEMVQPNIKYNREGLSDETLIQLYERLLMPRMIEEKMLRLQERKQRNLDQVMQLTRGLLNLMLTVDEERSDSADSTASIVLK